MKKIIVLTLCLTAALTAPLTTFAQVPTKSTDGKHNLNLDVNGCMVQGYDVVDMFTKPDTTIKGLKENESMYEGAKYWFASKENKSLFDTDPAKYAPLYGGYCALAVSQGDLRPIQVWTHEISNGHLVVNHNAKAKKLWDNCRKGRFKKAEKKWPAINAKDAKYDIIHSGETQESLGATSFEGPKK